MIERLQQKRNEEGFTLIELLIVIIVLGILAAIVVFAVSGTRKDAVASSCKAELKSIQLSAEAMFTKNGIYPAGDPVGTGNGALLKAMPTTNAAEYTFAYAQTGSGTGYQVTVTDQNSTPADTSVDSCSAVTN